MTLFSITDTSDYLNELLSEKQAGQSTLYIEKLSTYLLVEHWQPYRQRVHPSRQSV